MSEQQVESTEPPRVVSGSWTKEGSTWVWRTLFDTVYVKVINEGDSRQLMIDARNDIAKRGVMITVIPKHIIEDLYKEMVSEEVKKE